MKCKTIAFDTSTNSTGYAIYIDSIYSSSGIIDKSKIKDTSTRMSEMLKDIINLIKKEKPMIVTWEMPVVPRNAQAQRNLTMLVGGIWANCIENNIFSFSFRPTEWRKQVSDKDEKVPRKREELKIWGKEKVKHKLNIDIACDDESDAILIGLAYMNKFNLPEKE